MRFRSVMFSLGGITMGLGIAFSSVLGGLRAQERGSDKSEPKSALQLYDEIKQMKEALTALRTEEANLTGHYNNYYTASERAKAQIALALSSPSTIQVIRVESEDVKPIPIPGVQIHRVYSRNIRTQRAELLDGWTANLNAVNAEWAPVTKSLLEVRGKITQMEGTIAALEASFERAKLAAQLAEGEAILKIAKTLADQGGSILNAGTNSTFRTNEIGGSVQGPSEESADLYRTNSIIK